MKFYSIKFSKYAAIETVLHVPAPSRLSCPSKNLYFSALDFILPQLQGCMVQEWSDLALG